MPVTEECQSDAFARCEASPLWYGSFGPLISPSLANVFDRKHKNLTTASGHLSERLRVVVVSLVKPLAINQCEGLSMMKHIDRRHCSHLHFSQGTKSRGITVSLISAHAVCAIRSIGRVREQTVAQLVKFLMRSDNPWPAKGFWIGMARRW